MGTIEIKARKLYQTLFVDKRGHLNCIFRQLKKKFKKGAYLALTFSMDDIMDSFCGQLRPLSSNL